VQYIGLATRRIITDKQWRDGAKVKDQKTSEWNRRNGWRLPVSDFNDDAMKYFERDNGFVVV
jgi:hypothetical protein